MGLLVTKKILLELNDKVLKSYTDMQYCDCYDADDYVDCECVTNYEKFDAMHGKVIDKYPSINLMNQEQMLKCYMDLKDLENKIKS